MGKAVLKNFLPMAKAFSGTNQLLTQVSKILTSQLLEFAAFEQVPHLFLRIELRSIARQAFQMQPFPHWTGEKRFDYVGTMDGRAIPQEMRGDLGSFVAEVRKIPGNQVTTLRDVTSQAALFVVRKRVICSAITSPSSSSAK